MSQTDVANFLFGIDQKIPFVIRFVAVAQHGGDLDNIPLHLEGFDFGFPEVNHTDADFIARGAF